MHATALRVVETATHEPEPASVEASAVDVGVAAGLIHTWAAVQTVLLERQIRHSGALQRYVRGSRK